MTKVNMDLDNRRCATQESNATTMRIEHNLLQRFFFKSISMCEPLSCLRKIECTCDSRTILPWKYGWIESKVTQREHHTIEIANNLYPWDVKKKFTITNEMENHNRKNRKRLCTSCRNNAIHTNRIGSEIGFFHMIMHNNRRIIKATTYVVVVYSRNTLVWIFYSLYGIDSTVNCVCRSKNANKRVYFKWNSIRPFDKWCVSVFLPFDLPCALVLETRTSSSRKQQHEATAAATAWSLQLNTEIKVAAKSAYDAKEKRH